MFYYPLLPGRECSNGLDFSGAQHPRANSLMNVSLAPPGLRPRLVSVALPGYQSILLNGKSQIKCKAVSYVRLKWINQEPSLNEYGRGSLSLQSYSFEPVNSRNELDAELCRDYQEIKIQEMVGKLVRHFQSPRTLHL